MFSVPVLIVHWYMVAVALQYMVYDMVMHSAGSMLG